MKKSEYDRLLDYGDGGTKLESATARKFQASGMTGDLFSNTSEEMEMTANDSDDSFSIIQRPCLQKLFEKLSCPCCGIVGTLMTAILDCLSYGLSIKIKLECSSCNEVCIDDFMSSRLGKSTSSRARFVANIRAVLAFTSIDCCFSGLKDWCGTMNMPSCMSYDTFATSQSRVQQASKDTFCKLLETTRSSVQSAYNELGVLPDEKALFFTRNELVINLKPGKTESMLFSTQKKLSQNRDCIRLQYSNQTIDPTKECKYIGTIMDQKLSFNTNFHRECKKTSGKMGLLFSLRSYNYPETRVKICRGM